jgi:hypothetical protein
MWDGIFNQCLETGFLTNLANYSDLLPTNENAGSTRTISKITLKD